MGPFLDPVGAGTIRAFVLWLNMCSGSKGRGILRSFLFVSGLSVDPATDAGMKIIVRKLA